jgi:hypothetical protein
MFSHLPSHHKTFPNSRATQLACGIMDTDMKIDPEIAAMMGFGSFGGNKKRKFGADDAFTDAQPQEPQQVASKANAIPVAEARSRPVVPIQAPSPGEWPLSSTFAIILRMATDRARRHYTRQSAR